MAGIAALADNQRAVMVGVGIGKISCVMAVYAIGDSVRVRARRVVIYGGCHPQGGSTVVATGAAADNTGMIKTTVRFQFKKSDCVMTAVALRFGRGMKFGFAYRCYPVVTAAAVTEYFLVIDEGDDGKCQGCVAGLASAAGGDMIPRLTRYLAGCRCQVELVAVTIQAGRRQPLVVDMGRIGCVSDQDQLDSPLAGHAASVHHQLNPVGSLDVGNETWISRIGALQHGVAAVGSG